MRTAVLRSRHESLLLGSNQSERQHTDPEASDDSGGKKNAPSRARVGNLCLDRVARVDAGDGDGLSAVGAVGVGRGRERDNHGRVGVDGSAVARNAVLCASSHTHTSTRTCVSL